MTELRAMQQLLKYILTRRKHISTSGMGSRKEFSEVRDVHLVRLARPFVSPLRARKILHSLLWCEMGKLRNLISMFTHLRIDMMCRGCEIQQSDFYQAGGKDIVVVTFAASYSCPLASSRGK